MKVTSSNLRPKLSTICLWPISATRRTSLTCSFCGKSQNDVRKLIAGPGVYVCNECIDICNEIINDDEQTTSSTVADESAKAAGDQRLSSTNTSSGRTSRKSVSPSRSISITNGSSSPSVARTSSCRNRIFCLSARPERARRFLHKRLRASSKRSVLHCGRDQPDRGRICRRGC